MLSLIVCLYIHTMVGMEYLSLSGLQCILHKVFALLHYTITIKLSYNKATMIIVHLNE